jgi:hypothetical protein
MAKTPKTAETEDPPTSQMVTDTITYLPGPMDPPVTKWRGHTVHANIPKTVTTHAEHFDNARGNKFFQVGNEPVRRDRMKEPKTPEQYRAYLVDWLKNSGIQHARDLIARFAQDRKLQEACEVGASDYDLIATLFMPRLHELTKSDELSPEQVSAIWIDHGYNVLPW